MLIMEVGKQSYIRNKIEHFMTKVYLGNHRINCAEHMKTEKKKVWFCLVLRKSTP